jgi:hypothetical protein
MVTDEPVSRSAFILKAGSVDPAPHSHNCLDLDAHKVNTNMKHSIREKGSTPYRYLYREAATQRH